MAGAVYIAAGQAVYVPSQAGHNGLAHPLREA
jgi:hypothetical protein